MKFIKKYFLSRYTFCYLQTFGGATRIVRTMPNTPCMVECGVVVYALNQDCSADDGELIKVLFNPIGMCDVLFCYFFQKLFIFVDVITFKILSG